MRRVVSAAAFALAFALASVVLHQISPSLFRVSPSAELTREAAEASRNVLVQVQQESLRQMQLDDRAVYPYSVIPGGIKDAHDLKWMADHDPVVRAHYAGFDYDHARVVRLTLARTAYISYRIGNKVYFTRHRVTLHKGETVITDGNITARGRCGNRVEEVPQQATSTSEPPAAKFDEPVQPSTGTAVEGPPVPFQSALMNRPGVPGLGPAPLSSVYDPFSPGTWIPISPPPLPGVCGVGKKPKGGGGGGPVAASTGKKGTGGNPCASGGGGEVPEPGTWLLVASGLGLLYWKMRHRFARA